MIILGNIRDCYIICNGRITFYDEFTKQLLKIQQSIYNMREDDVEFVLQLNDILELLGELLIDVQYNTIGFDVEFIANEINQLKLQISALSGKISKENQDNINEIYDFLKNFNTIETQDAIADTSSTTILTDNFENITDNNTSSRGDCRELSTNVFRSSAGGAAEAVDVHEEGDDSVDIREAARPGGAAEAVDVREEDDAENHEIIAPAPRRAEVYCNADILSIVPRYTGSAPDHIPYHDDRLGNLYDHLLGLDGRYSADNIAAAISL